jgi:nucleotide-binding universal stress UspA family protein
MPQCATVPGAVTRPGAEARRGRRLLACDESNGGFPMRATRPGGTEPRATRRQADLEPLRIRSLLLPLDGSPFAEQAIPWAAAIARKARARLRLALVHQAPQPAPSDRESRRTYTRIELALRKSQRDYLRAAAARIKGEGGLQTATATLEGAPAPAIGSYIREVGVDLVVMTTHGRGGVERAWLGSVADQLVRSLEIPVLLVRPTADAVPAPRAEEILVPLDGSPRAEAALPPAMAMAELFGSRLTLLQGVEPVGRMGDLPTPFAGELDEELTRSRRAEAEDYLKDVAERVVAAGITARASSVLSSNPVEAIQAGSRAPSVGMIALATHGRGGLRRMVLGSVADKLVRSGDLPVLVTRPRGR